MRARALYHITYIVKHQKHVIQEGGLFSAEYRNPIKFEEILKHWSRTKIPEETLGKTIALVKDHYNMQTKGKNTASGTNRKPLLRRYLLSCDSVKMPPVGLVLLEGRLSW